MKFAARATVLLLMVTGLAAAQSNENFPRPASLQPAVDFWTRVYTEVGTQGGFLHDPVNLAVVYHVVRFEGTPTARQRRREIDKLSDHYSDILNRLADSRDGLSTEEARVLALWPAKVSDSTLKQAAQQLRFQLGQADRFEAGLIRSGRWKPYIHGVLAERGLPSELAVLPHVESSFDPTAYSKVGAAGMWQFTRSTGLRYMQIDHIVDERRDPFLATVAAAQLLADNYSVISSWPLALTAYNHGLSGMRRAVRQQNTSDIGVIVQSYQSRSFGFASRNFYAAFLAALDVDTNAERYFRTVRLDAPDDSVIVKVPDYIDAGTIASALKLRVDDLKRLNPALMDTIWAGDKFVPKGFMLRLPGNFSGDADKAMAAVPGTQRFALQRADEFHRVRRGETLSAIAGQYRLSVDTLVRANGLRSQNFIREGQMLTLPVTSPGSAVVLASAVDASGQYTVRRGDSIAAIARRLGVAEGTLLAANGIRDKNRIFEGQTLNVPGVGSEAIAQNDVAVVLASNNVTETSSSLASEGNLALAANIVAEPVDFLLDVEAEAEPAADEQAETIDEDAEPTLDSNVLASMQARLAADPSDYSVSGDNRIEVQSLETLGHYADWLQVRTQKLRDMNGFSFRQAVVIGQRVELDFSAVSPAQFEQRRLAYQERVQETFFSAYQIAAIQEHVIRSGESLWLLAQHTYSVPVWLLRQYNPDLNLDRVSTGAVVKFPRLKRINSSAAQVPTEGELG
jgi:membrane-bound lytic murein transglycosylase D